ncbi:hypothetical protein GOP47_0006102 [Adiantum capillus-veneris]|uniref:Uncharacterized protein n=1 Tax=Adiantum capillus-veneris TaxID=13818 RepID=A0A9D4ZM81_ADICA|nr:hypothetical protein GOP47_0006102 [Adiantum capillus-veneris]
MPEEGGNCKGRVLSIRTQLSQKNLGLVGPLSSPLPFSPTCKNPSCLAEKCARFPAGRYRSPTDSLVSPISRGLLLAKGRKALQPLPTFTPPKVLDPTYDVAGNL